MTFTDVPRRLLALIALTLVLVVADARIPRDGAGVDGDGLSRRTLTISSLVVIIPLLIIGWYASRDRIKSFAAAREGFTGPFPVVAERPGIDRKK